MTALTARSASLASQALPEAWRDVDVALYRWVLHHGGDPDTARAAAWLSLADGQGHSALDLRSPPHESMPAWSTVQIARLAASPWVQTRSAQAEGAAAPPTPPFILDGEHLYLARNHRAETAVASALRCRRAHATSRTAPPDATVLDALFPASANPAEARQRSAVQNATGHRLLVLTGGPGTGKTTTVLRMLLVLSRAWLADNGALPRIRVCAPTGKAAQRLGQSMREGAALIQSHLTQSDLAWNAHLDAALAHPASTVHRLLGSRGRQGGFRFKRSEPLPCDIVVVDEASILDLELLRALLAALREDTLLLLVGDADQLTSVGTGSVLMDIVTAMEAEARGDLTRLEHCFRADTALIPIHDAVRAGDPAGFAEAFRTAATLGRAQHRSITDFASLRRALDHWQARLHASLFNAALDITASVERDDSAALATRLAALQQQQLLCALREGPFGADALTAMLARDLRRWPELSAWQDQSWYPGRCVMVSRNDAAAGLFNGDVGICVRVRDEASETCLHVAFEPTPEAALAGQRVRLFDPNTLPPHQDAFALTIHKSQGSEYQHVAVLLPPDPQSPLLNRQALYTGLSRAKTSLEVWASDAAIDRAITRTLQRHGCLAERMGASQPTALAGAPAAAAMGPNQDGT
ncbi:MAG: exodeoxyribonuclease V subunit alpha [Xanthomonadales bacterium]|nr:exodeoxyribonuclease V subunit alpha [Xanthomonadales bacterium]